MEHLKISFSALFMWKRGKVKCDHLKIFNKEKPFKTSLISFDLVPNPRDYHKHQSGSMILY